MARVAEKFSSSYNTLFNDMADPRVKDWLLMSDPGLVMILVVMYIYFITSLGPSIMVHRIPFKLKNIILVYNIFQVISNALLFYKIYTSGWSTTLSLGCEPVDYSDNPLAVSLAESVWWYMILKIIELIETIFFVLRKKQNQASFLHVYHHVSTLTFSWLVTKYFAGGMSTFCLMLNCLIHVIMYVYYLLAAVGNEAFQKYLAKWKKYLTTVQMIQFFVIVIHTMQTLSPKCQMTIKSLSALFIVNVIVIFILFYRFYKTSYKKQN